MSFSLHDAVRAIQLAHRNNLTDAERSEAAKVVESRVQKISRGKDFRNLSDADRKEVMQDTLLKVIQASKPFSGGTTGQPRSISNAPSGASFSTR